MKKTALLAFGTLLISSISAFAVLTLPYADDATTYQGEMVATAALTIESDINMYGARFSYGVLEDLSLFIGVGLADFDGADTEPYLQLGGKYTLAVDLPVDLAVRGAIGFVSFEESFSDGFFSEKYELDIWTLNIGLLASMPIDEAITVYGFGGISYQNIEAKGRFTETFGGRTFSESFSASDTETELAIGAGALFTPVENIAVGAEIAIIDDAFLSLFGRYTF